jgi:hypothetical protein
VYRKMLSQHFGARESAFQAFLYAYLHSATTAEVMRPEWNVESISGDGRMGISLTREGDEHAANLEMKRLSLPYASGQSEDTQNATATSSVKRRGRPRKDGRSSPVKEGYAPSSP